MHQRLARPLEFSLRRHVVQQYVTIGPDGRNSSDPLAFDRNKNSVSRNPLPHVLCRLVAEPRRQRGRVIPVVEVAKLPYRPTYDVDGMVGIGNLRWSNLHLST